MAASRLPDCCQTALSFHRLTGETGTGAGLATGAGLLLVLLLVPGGLGALFGDARDGALRWYARRKGIRVPSLLADTLVEPEIPAGPLEALNEATQAGKLEVQPQ